MILTYRYRVKDATKAKHLAAMARAVNVVWNYCGEVQIASRRHNKRRPSGFDLINLTSGSSVMLGLHSDTIAEACRQFARSRDKNRRRPRWRGKKSLGWVPLRARAIKVRGDAAILLGRRYRLWMSRPINGPIKTGSFTCDARGRWYLNLQVDVPEIEGTGRAEVGVDLGLKSLAVMSDGTSIDNNRYVARWADKLATAQRAGRKRRAVAIHAKIVNCRRHNLHVESTRLVRRCRRIVVGDVSPAKLAKTKMAKSVLDAGWASFKTQLRYKAMRHGVEYEERSERLSTQACSDCGAISGPKGRKGLDVRAWVCHECGVLHDRDVNAATNLLLGLKCQPPLAGIAA